MPLTASQSGLGVVKGLFTDDYRSTSNSTSRSSQHLPQSPQSQILPFQHQQQQQRQQQQHNRQFLPSSTSPSSKHTKVTTTTTTTNRGQRGRTHSNTTSVIDPSALQYASKFSNSNNNVTVSATIAGHANVSGPTNSTMAPPQGALQQLHSHHHNSTSTHAPSNSSTTTTFYSGVKLAPPVLSASVEQLGRRASDQKIWYTIQVCPCDLTIITPVVQASVSSSNAAATSGSGACSGGTGVTSIPRKPYKIYRRYEDVADFADQLEEEFTGRVVFPSTMIGLQQDSKDSNAAASIATSTSGGVISSSGYCINGNVPGLGSMAFTEKGILDGGVSATSIGSNNNNNNNTNTNTNQCNSSSASSTSTITVSLPRLKSRLVLFVTKAVCLQRKEELDRYLQELFILGPVIAQSRLVAEFFGIWKTDMEVHLSQEDRDPLALHSVAAVTTVFDNEIKDKDKDGSMDHDHQKEHDDAPEANNGGDTAGSEEDEVLRDGRTTSAGFPVSKTTMMDSSSALRALSPSPLPPPIPSNNAGFALEAEALSTYKSSSLSMSDATFPSTIAQLSSTAASMKNMNSTYLASPSLSPSPSAYESQDMGWTPSLSTLLPLASQTGNDVDAEMASPIEPTAPAPFELTHLDPITDGYESGAGTETEMINDLTTRTIKKFKSLRRAHTSSHSRQQQQQQQDLNGQEDARPRPPVRSSSISEPSGGGTATVPSTSSMTKIMKRSKTIVFRPEVTMQPLSSKNVIPPWNRIPSFANSNNTGAAPISPISPTSPHSATIMSLSSTHSTPNTVAGDHHTRAASPTYFDMDDQYCQQQQQPRKLGMSHSKTMSSISTTPSWSFGNTNNSANDAATTAATTDHPTLPAGSLAGLSFSAMSTNSSNSAGGSSLNRSGSISNTGARSMSISSGITQTTTLVAPWNRANAHGETNTHLHSLIKISGQLSPSLQSPMIDSPFIPVELGRSFHKKESQAQKSPSNRVTKDRAVPVLTQPPEARNRNPESASLSFLGGSGGGGRVKKPGMTHSVSAPGGFLPIMTVSAPDTSSSPSSNSVSGSVSTEDMSGASVKTTVTRKRVSLHSPSLSNKQPVGILKNAQRGARKASLAVPGAVMFPVQPSLTTSLAASSTMGSASALSPSSSPSPSVTPTPPGGGGGTHGAGTLATTFKIVMDADTIVALQVLEDSSFVLTMPELRSRVKAKLTKSNIQLPDKFDLLWTAPTNSMTLASPSPSPLPAPSPLSPTSGMSAMSIHQTANAVAVAAALDQGVMLKTDEDLHRAIHASRNHKVTLRCIL